MVAGYAAARFAGVLADNLRNALFEKVGQDAARRLAGQVFRHVHDLSLRFHLERRTGSLTKIVERGTKSIDMMLYFLLFNIGPTLIELTAACIIFFVKFGAGLVAATLAMIVALYRIHAPGDRMARTASAADERRRQQGDRSRGRQPAELRNSQIFRRRGARGASATTKRSAPSRAPTVRNEVSLAWLNIGQALITNLMLAGAMIFTVWGWSHGRFTPGDVVFINTHAAAAFRPLDMLGWVYRSIRQGLIDMEAMWDLLDAPAEINDRPARRAARSSRSGAGAVRRRAVRL